MKVILEPTVEIVAATQFIGSSEFPIPDDGTDAVKVASFAAKMCYDSKGKDGRSNQENQFAILEHRHGSVLEHSHATLKISGISRALSLEMNRHRLLAISQRSTRYVKEEDAAIVLDPYYAHLFIKHKFTQNPSGAGWIPTGGPSPRDFKEIRILKDFLNTCEFSIYEYEKQVDTLIELNPLSLEGFELRKWARGKARNVLPHALETQVVYTGNIRAWRWFIESRSNRHAEPEIRRLADVVFNKLSLFSPVHFHDFSAHVYDDINEWVPKHSKV